MATMDDVRKELEKNYSSFTTVQSELTPDDYRELMDGIAQGKTSVSLISSNLSGAGIAELVRILPDSDITDLALSGSKLSPADWDALADILPTTKITDLNVTSANCDETSLKKLAAALPGTKIRSLNLHDNPYGDAGAQAVAEVVAQCPLLEKLSFGNDGTTDATLHAFAKTLPQAELQAISFMSKTMSDAGVMEIAGCLPSTNLTSFSISDADVGDIGATALAEALPTCKLTNLYLNYNKIGANGAMALGAVLPFSTLNQLWLDQNPLGDQGAAAIFDVLPQTQLALLNMDKCQVSNMAAKRLAAALPHCGLTEIALQYNPIGMEGLQPLRDVIEQSTLTRISLGDISISRPEQRVLEDECSALARSKGDQLLETMDALFGGTADLTSELLSTTARQLHGLRLLQQRKNPRERMTESVFNQQMATLADTAYTQGFQEEAAQLMLTLKPFDDAKAWMDEKGIAFGPETVLDEAGQFPKNRIVCQRGLEALFRLEEPFWESKKQAEQVVSQFDPAQRHLFTGLHGTLASLSRMERAEARSQSR